MKIHLEIVGTYKKMLTMASIEELSIAGEKLPPTSSPSTMIP